jgi:predicted nucleic acid-binding protein
VAVDAFLDTSVLLAGLVDFGPQSGPAQQVLHAVVEGRVKRAATAWDCCLELFSVATRLPAEYRLSPMDAETLLREEVFGRMQVLDLPAGDRLPFLTALVHERTIGGRVYDAHIADVARAAGTPVIVTDNRRHFLTSLKHGIRVETAAEFAASLKRGRS